MALLLLRGACVELNASRRVERTKLYGGIYRYGYYWLDLHVGLDGPQLLSVVADTASAATAVSCSQCVTCSSRHIDEPFDFSKSRSAKWLGCSADCEACVDDRCSYDLEYAEGSSIKGHYFEDWVQLGDSFSPELSVRAPVGCNVEERKILRSQRASGILGMAPAWDESGRLPVFQTMLRDRRHVREWVFAMCLADDGGSLVMGGFDASVHRGPVQWTPMVAQHYYLLQLGSLRIGESLVATGPAFGDVIMDSGTTHTMFPLVVYNSLVSLLRLACELDGRCGTYSAVDGSNCWRLDSPDADLDHFPTLDFEFENSVTVKWPRSAYLYQKSAEEDVWCTFFDRIVDQTTILGMNFMLHQDVIFDLHNGRMGFAPADCPKAHSVTAMVLGLEDELRSVLKDFEQPPGAGAVGLEGLEVARAGRRPAGEVAGGGALAAGFVVGVCGLMVVFVVLVAAAFGSFLPWGRLPWRRQQADDRGCEEGSAQPLHSGTLLESDGLLDA